VTPTDPLAEALREGVRGRVTTSAAEVEPYSTDFSGVCRSVPRAVVVPAHEQDVIHALRMARSFGLPVAIRGAGHSANGRTVSDGGILLVNRADHAECEIQADGRVEVSARTPWRLLQIELARRGRAAPVLTDYLDLTVGGTLSVGGYGVRSIADGAQVEHVERLRLICPDGIAVWCSPRERADLFRSSLAGLGQAGVIERVVLRTIPYVRFTDLYACEHETTDALLDALRLATEAADPRPDHFLAYITAERITSQYGRSVTSLERALLGEPP
jgi:FAD/FMN-containing dehydrogenase